MSNRLLCKDPQAHRLYHAMDTSCPCRVLTLQALHDAANRCIAEGLEPYKLVVDIKSWARLMDDCDVLRRYSNDGVNCATPHRMHIYTLAGPIEVVPYGEECVLYVR